MTRLLPWLALAVLGTVLTACLPDTENFLSERGSASADARLLGAWYASEKDEIIMVHFVRDRAGAMEMLWTGQAPRLNEEDGGPVTWRRYAAWTTRIDGVNYLNLDLIDPKPQDEGNAMIVRYTVGRNGRLTGYLMGETVVAAIKRGELAGRVEGTGATATPHVTASRTALIAFIRKRGPRAVFSHDLPAFRRLPVSRDSGD